MLVMVSSVEAKTNENLNPIDKIWYYDNAITFIENGVEFTLFLNGEFDFNTRFGNTYFDYNGIRINKNRVTIIRDRKGRIIRIGNTFLNYNFRGKLNRIGSIFINYQRGFVSRVGDLQIKYRRNNPYFYGQVHYNNYNYGNLTINVGINLEDICDYNDAFFYKSNFRNNYYRLKEDQNFYYYKAKPNASIGKRSSIIKRRKATSINIGQPNKRVSINNNSKRFEKKPNRKHIDKRVLRKRNEPINSGRTSKRSDNKTMKKRS